MMQLYGLPGLSLHHLLHIISLAVVSVPCQRGTCLLLLRLNASMSLDCKHFVEVESNFIDVNITLFYQILGHWKLIIANFGRLTFHLSKRMYFSLYFIGYSKIKLSTTGLHFLSFLTFLMQLM